MKTIAITGGSSLVELGCAIEVKLFFDLINLYVYQDSSSGGILSDRLYKRYIRKEELHTATQEVTHAMAVFEKTTSSVVDWAAYREGVGELRLNMAGFSLADIFEVYFEGFFHCAESASINYEAFKDYPKYQYEPVRLVIADQPWYMAEKKRPLSDYDTLEGKPFWLIS